MGTTNYRSRSWLVPLLVCFALAYGAQKMNAYLIQQQPKEIRQQLERVMPPN